MKRTAAIAMLGLAACGAGGPDNMVNDANPGGDATNGCSISLFVTPAMPVAGDHVRVTATVHNGAGVFGYDWLVNGTPNTAYEAADHSAIGFDAPTATSYAVSVGISPNLGGCQDGTTTVNVGNPMGQLQNYRLRVVPDATLAPPQEVVVQVHGGQSFDRPLLLDGGFRLQGTVKSGGTPIAAYVRLTPVLGPSFDTVTSTGGFDVHVQLQMHAVLVIPASAALAPRAIAWMPGLGITDFNVDAGTAVSGTVVGRTGAALANAKVQLESGGVPSTIATTDGGGNFTVRTAFPAAMPVTVTVTPPATSGLARLTATGNLDVSQAVQISYVGSPVTCDLSGTPVQRGGANQGSAKVSVVGALAGTIGTVATGGTSVNATGTVHVAATAGGGGTLPSTLVPRAALSAVVELANGDLAVSALDTSACAATTIDAPAMISKNGIARDPAHAPIAGVRVEATPVGALAMANLIPVQATSTTGGAFALTLASGGHYELRFFDPSGRGAPLVFADTTAAGVPPTADLAAALAITGLVSVFGDPNPIENASVQVLCTACTGVEASRPIAQTATDITSHYRVAVPDPGM